MANIELPAPADRTIHLTGTIDETASENFIRKVDEIDAYDITMATNTLIHVNSLGFDATAYTPPPIKVVINSPGGYIYDALSIYDTIDGRQDMVCVATGKCMSAATFILLAFPNELRLATANTTFMLHSVSSMTYGKTATMEEDLKETKRLQKVMDGIYTSRSTIPKELLEEIHKTKKDLYLTAKEALKYNIISKII